MGRHSNVWKVIEFSVEDYKMVRQLVPEVTDFEVEISTQSPVGRGLMMANVGDEFEVNAPGGDVAVKVLGVSGTAR